MFDPNQTQLNLEVEDDQPEPGHDLESSQESPEEEYYYSGLTGGLISESEVDRYAHTRPCSDFEAFAHFRISFDKVEADEEPAKAPERKKHTRIIVANNLGERALHLLKATYSYEKSVEAEESVHDLFMKGDEEASDKALVDQVVFKKEGDQEFYRSWYAGGLKKRKLDTIIERRAAKESQTDFYDLSTNPERHDELFTLVKSLVNQKNRAQAKNGQIVEQF